VTRRAGFPPQWRETAPAGVEVGDGARPQRDPFQAAIGHPQHQFVPDQVELGIEGEVTVGNGEMVRTGGLPDLGGAA
jgi:hypothetical protein